MEGFQKIVLYSAIIILLIVLVIIGVSLSYSSDQNWPPISQDCPDYWVFRGDETDTKCVNVKDLGTCKPTGQDKHLTMDFSTGPFTGTNANCNKYTWANKCGVSWDGITYGVQPPCQA